MLILSYSRRRSDYGPAAKNDTQPSITAKLAATGFAPGLASCYNILRPKYILLASPAFMPFGGRAANLQGPEKFMRILLIEDDPLIGDGIATGLGRQGFTIDWFEDGLLGLEAARSADYDAVILDLTLPGEDGLNILRRWRTEGLAVPVLILTARGSLDDRVEGLDLGADDYLGKPFALSELAARLRALVRRSHGQNAPFLRHGQLELNPAARTVSLQGQNVALSPKEIALLELLLLNRGAVLSKDIIESKLYAWGEDVSSNAVEVHAHHIRRKLGAELIKTVHGLGYILGDLS